MNKIKEILKSNNELTRNLTPDNFKIMTDLVVYLRVSRISDDRFELIRQDLLDMALNAQERNEPLSDVFGTDYKSFCDEIISNEKSEWLKKVVKGLPYLPTLFGLLAVLLVDDMQLISEDERIKGINVEIGERVAGFKELNGWIWCEKMSNRNFGWVPKNNLRPELEIIDL